MKNPKDVEGQILPYCLQMIGLIVGYLHPEAYPDKQPRRRAKRNYLKRSTRGNLYFALLQIFLLCIWVHLLNASSFVIDLLDTEVKNNWCTLWKIMIHNFLIGLQPTATFP